MANLIQRVEARSGHDCFDRIVITGYLSALTRPEHAVYNNSSGKSWAFVPSTKEVLKQRTDDYHQGSTLTPGRARSPSNRPRRESASMDRLMCAHSEVK
jgi:hypothetical protein